MKKGLFIVFCLTGLLLSVMGQDIIQNINMRKSAAWPRSADGVTRIEVTFENPEGNEKEIQIIKKAVEDTWSKYANIRFFNWGKAGPNQRGIRIYIHHLASMDGRPNVKRLGNEIDGIINGMELNPEWAGGNLYPPDISLRFVAIHEFGHALGFAHEQNRSDYKKNCKCYVAIIESDFIGDGGGGDYYLNDCDEQSVMNYCNKDWNNNGKLSELDIIGVQTIYGINPLLLPKERNLSTIKIMNELSNDQVWENLFIQLGEGQQLLHVDKKNVYNVVKFYNKTGNVPYKIWSRTLYSDGEEINGSGQGYIYIPDKSITNFEVYIQDNINYPEYGKLILKSK